MRFKKIVEDTEDDNINKILGNKVFAVTRGKIDDIRLCFVKFPNDKNLIILAWEELSWFWIFG